MKLKNKIAVITGASTGIGRAIAVKLASEGAKTILLARSKDELENTLKLVKQAGGEGKIFCIDLRQIDEIKKLAQSIKESEGEIDILVNVAGIWHSKDKAFSGIEFRLLTWQLKRTKNFSQRTLHQTMHFNLKMSRAWLCF